ncbi:MAG: hypothetical protein JSR54_04405 [Proteobacteria bacterium]|nr:hypothetical protein [Pseudomonadota bacterium]
MTAAALIAGIIPMFVDLSPSHVFNSAWPAHARLHEVWLLSTGGLVALISLYLLWIDRQGARSLGLATALMIALLGGFFVAAATMDRYGGVLIDPATVSLMPNQDRMLGLPANLAVFGIGLVLAVIGYLTARGAVPER